MVQFWKRLTKGESKPEPALGTLESTVMETLWQRGESSVAEVVQWLGRPRAYTTVMTTLDRLFKKDLLSRRRLGRGFAYSPRFSRQEWEQLRARALVSGFLLGQPGQPSSGEMLISCFVEALGQHDANLLDELEREIKTKRKEMDKELDQKMDNGGSR